MTPGLCVAVDVQHLYRTGIHAHDRGTRFDLGNGQHIYEAQAATAYAQGIIQYLTAQGARVLTNDPGHWIFVGPYTRRGLAAVAWGAHAYLACHVNAGGGDYGLVEYSRGNLGAFVAYQLRRWSSRRVGTSPLFEGGNVQQRTLVPGGRGYVCLEGFDEHSSKGYGALLEPFFGDGAFGRWVLGNPESLHQLGQFIGLGVCDWWDSMMGQVA